MGGDERRDVTTNLSAPPHSDAEDPFLRLVAASASGGGTNGDPGVPRPGEVIDGKYLVRRLIGRGGMGWVYEALHLQTDKTVALKFLRRDLAGSGAWIERFAVEARTAGKIDHPNVIRIYDVGGGGAGTYIVMEYLHGETLRDRLRSGPMRHEEAIPMLLAVMRGVAEAHRLGVVHRDLKPDNIFLCILRNGQPDVPKVLDFGVSKVLDPVAELRADRTPLGHVGGTPLYMPLEHLQGGPVDARGDVYALGVVLFEVLTGEFPFPARNREDLALALSTRAAARLPASVHPCADRMNEVLERALARDASARYPSVNELAQALAAVPVRAQSTARPKKLKHAMIGGAGLTLALLPLIWPGPGDVPRAAATRPEARVAAPASRPQSAVAPTPSPATVARRVDPTAPLSLTPPASSNRARSVAHAPKRRRPSKPEPVETPDDGISRALEFRRDDF